ncbi:uncharacterized protein A4U43_C08F9950 [Asparagus officinalis]|nr:uncharacterized protein A4U43_C08F9950 [Asparagus officinalis]
MLWWLISRSLSNAASVAKTFLTSDVVVVDIKEPEHIPARNPMDNSGRNIYVMRMKLEYCQSKAQKLVCALMALLLPPQEEVEEAVLEGFPVGFRFCPTDLDLVDFYLRKRKQGCPNPDLFIQELDIYKLKYQPWKPAGGICLFCFPERGEKGEGEEVIAPLNLQLVDEVLALQALPPLQCLTEGSSNEASRGRGCFKRKRVEVEGAADDRADCFAAVGSLEECMKGVVDQQQFALVADQTAAASLLMPSKEEIQETMPVGAAANGEVGDELFSMEDVDFDNIDVDLCCRLLDECLQDDLLEAIGQDDRK